jgi:hypothetical protein
MKKNTVRQVDFLQEKCCAQKEERIQGIKKRNNTMHYKNENVSEYQGKRSARKIESKFYPILVFFLFLFFSFDVCTGIPCLLTGME